MAPDCKLALRRLLALAALTSIACTAIAAVQVAELRLGILAWVFAQSLLVTLPAVIVANLVCRTRAACVANRLSAIWILALPTLMLLDAFTFRWIGERFLSNTVWRIATLHRSVLLAHVTSGMLIAGGLLIITLALITYTLRRLAYLVAQRWTTRRPTLFPRRVLLWGVILAGLSSAPALWQLSSTREAMWMNSTPHPFCVLGWLAYQRVGTATPERAQANDSSPSVSFEQAIDMRENQLRLVTVAPSADAKLPDIAIVVIESLRHELVDPEIMPTLSALAGRGLNCRAHFSGGNATNHGMFSIVGGLEAIWFERPIRFSPALNRLFRSAGYEVGFFAGHDQWRNFYMDGFLNQDQFDVFEVMTANGLDSDRAATEQASQFLDRRDLSEQELAQETRPPRLAILYLYATHATYLSYAEDRVFRPAADDRFLYPYAQSSQPEVWNRYKNAARTVDRFLKPMLRDDRIVIVTGDHGEAFLEDGTIGHGIRISKVQNMTPAVIFAPGLTPRVIDQPTCHADLLPTVLAAAGLRISNANVLDGVDLTSAQSLADRSFVTRNYLQDDVALIGPWTIAEEPFAYRASVSLKNTNVNALNAIDERGNEIESVTSRQSQLLADWLKVRFAVRQAF
jgi:Sulfatase